MCELIVHVFTDHICELIVHGITDHICELIVHVFTDHICELIVHVFTDHICELIVHTFKNEILTYRAKLVIFGRKLHWTNRQSHSLRLNCCSLLDAELCVCSNGKSSTLYSNHTSNSQEETSCYLWW